MKIKYRKVLAIGFPVAIFMAIIVSLSFATEKKPVRIKPVQTEVKPKVDKKPAVKSREITGVDFVATPHAKSREITGVDFIATPHARSREITGVDFVGTPTGGK